MTAVPSVAQLLALADKAQDRPLTPAEAGRLRTGIQALTAHPSQTCDASVIGLMDTPVGPCVLRYQHDGPVCQAADGTRWARTAAVRPPDGLNPHAATNESSGPENGAQTGAQDAALREQYSEAIWNADPGTFTAPTVAAVLTAVLAVRDRELEKLREQLHLIDGMRQQNLDAAAAAIQRAEKAETVIARVRALHHDWDADPGHCAHCQDGMGTPLPWPCPTIRALDAPQAGDGTGTATLTVTVTAPNQENADQWAGTLRDLITAEHGDAMRLHMTISPRTEGADTTGTDSAHPPVPVCFYPIAEPWDTLARPRLAPAWMYCTNRNTTKET